MIEANDDLGTYVKPYRVVACVPVYGRLPLLRHTIERLYKKNKCYKVICSGDGAEERELCESLGAVWVPCQNRPLAKKWNEAFKKAKEFSPDAVLYVGSSDFLSDNWIDEMKPYVDKYNFVGVAGCHFLHIGLEDIKVCFWPGYKATVFHKDRGNESIGIGRMISAKAMDLIGWKPFNPTFDNSLDRSMKEQLKKVGFDDFMVTEDIKAVSISTDHWPNKHNFKHHWHGTLPSQKISDADLFVDENFPEIKSVFK